MNEPILDSMHKIRIEYVRGIIPKSVYNRLKKLRIATIGDLNDLDRNEYIDLECNHPLNLSKFDDFREQITAAPESVILHFISWYHVVR